MEYRGVRWSKGHNKWLASINQDGKKRYLGYYDSAEEAAMVVNKMATRLYGDTAILNVVSLRS